MISLLVSVENLSLVYYNTHRKQRGLLVVQTYKASLISQITQLIFFFQFNSIYMYFYIDKNKRIIIKLSTSQRIDENEMLYNVMDTEQVSLGACTEAMACFLIITSCNLLFFSLQFPVVMDWEWRMVWFPINQLKHHHSLDHSTPTVKQGWIHDRLLPSKAAGRQPLMRQTSMCR